MHTGLAGFDDERLQRSRRQEYTGRRWRIPAAFDEVSMLQGERPWAILDYLP
jgi:hypothetical protein